MDMAVANANAKRTAAFNFSTHGITQLYRVYEDLSKTSNVFWVRLSPLLTRSLKDLWRLGTSEEHVRGEEILSSWHPRGIAVIEDHTKLIGSYCKGTSCCRHAGSAPPARLA